MRIVVRKHKSTLDVGTYSVDSLTVVWENHVKLTRSPKIIVGWGSRHPLLSSLRSYTPRGNTSSSGTHGAIKLFHSR